MFFSKYSASGNDFILTHLFSYQGQNNSQLARQICHRQQGVGADGLIIIKPSAIHDFEWEFYNCDGSMPKMCGNGSRAAALYAYDASLAPAKQAFLTKAGVIYACIDGHWVESELTCAHLLQSKIQACQRDWWLIDTGVPHLVTFADASKPFMPPKETLKQLRHQYNANINIATIMPDFIGARTYERGVEDETLACGTGMAAMFFLLSNLQKIPNHTLFKPASGEDIYLRQEGGKIFLKGEVRKICDFTYQIG